MIFNVFIRKIKTKMSDKLIVSTKVFTPIYIYSCLNFSNYRNEFSETFEKLNYSKKNDGLLALFAFYAKRRGSKIIDIEKIEHYAAKDYTNNIHRNYIEVLQDYNPEALRYIRAFCEVMNLTPLIRNSQKICADRVMTDAELLGRASFLYHHGVFMHIALQVMRLEEDMVMQKCFIIDNWIDMDPIKDADLMYLGNDTNEREEEPEDIDEDIDEEEPETPKEIDLGEIFTFAPVPKAYDP